MRTVLLQKLNFSVSGVMGCYVRKVFSDYFQAFQEGCYDGLLSIVRPQLHERAFASVASVQHWTPTGLVGGFRERNPSRRVAPKGRACCLTAPGLVALILSWTADVASSLFSFGLF